MLLLSLSILSFIQLEDSVIVVSYHQLLQDPMETIQQLYYKLQSIGRIPPDLITPLERSQIEEFVDPSLNHSSNNKNTLNNNNNNTNSNNSSNNISTNSKSNTSTTLEFALYLYRCLEDRSAWKWDSISLPQLPSECIELLDSVS